MENSENTSSLALLEGLATPCTVSLEKATPVLHLGSSRGDALPPTSLGHSDVRGTWSRKPLLSFGALAADTKRRGSLPVLAPQEFTAYISLHKNWIAAPKAGVSTTQP